MELERLTALFDDWAAASHRARDARREVTQAYHRCISGGPGPCPALVAKALNAEREEDLLAGRCRRVALEAMARLTPRR